MAPDEADIDELSGYLRALAHPSRLELLSQLRVPRTLGEIRLKPQRDEVEGNPDRLISRNAAERHLQSLVAIGVVVRRESTRDGRKVDEYTLQHARLFQVVEELRELTHLRPVDPVALAQTEGATVGGTRAEPVEIRAPQLVLLSGPAEGRVHGLDKGARWVVGRSATADVVVDHDPYVSLEHAEVQARGKDLIVHDLPSNRNGTWLNWRPLPRGGSAPLRNGDVIRLGRTLILYQEPRGR